MRDTRSARLLELKAAVGSLGKAVLKRDAARLGYRQLDAPKNELARKVKKHPILRETRQKVADALQEARKKLSLRHGQAMSLNERILLDARLAELQKLNLDEATLTRIRQTREALKWGGSTGAIRRSILGTDPLFSRKPKPAPKAKPAPRDKVDELVSRVRVANRASPVTLAYAKPTFEDFSVRFSTFTEAELRQILKAEQLATAAATRGKSRDELMRMMYDRATAKAGADMAEYTARLRLGSP
jgi:hypothetical protein